MAVQVVGDGAVASFPPELAVFASLLDVQPAQVRDGFLFCLALAMVEAGKARVNIT